jgi:hypothetical protein
MTPIEELKEKAKCRDCGRFDYCNRIPLNQLIVDAIKKSGKCPDYYSYSPVSA